MVWTCEHCVKNNTYACYFREVIDGYKHCNNVLVDADTAYNKALDDLIELMKSEYFGRIDTQFDNAILEMEKFIEKLKK